MSTPPAVSTVPKDSQGEPLALLPTSANTLTVEEVGSLWAFLHGDIMNASGRTLLREHWGLCARHSWGHAVVEIELWEDGAGARGGHQPFDVCVLYRDLLGTMVSSLSAGRVHHKNKALRSQGECLICKEFRSPPVTSQIGYAGFNSEKLHAEAGPMTHTRTWIAETFPIWREHACPKCSETADAVVSSGQLCRRHLIEGGTQDEHSLDQTREYLARLQQPLLQLLDSMTQQGDASTPEADAAWIETLGWFHGWELPYALSERNDRS